MKRWSPGNEAFCVKVLIKSLEVPDEQMRKAQEDCIGRCKAYTTRLDLLNKAIAQAGKLEAAGYPIWQFLLLV